MTLMRRLALAGTVLALHALVAGAQNQPTFRASTRLVQVSVVVEGRDGQPVSGLTANDFRVFDGGQEQRIELFLTDAATASAETRESPPAATTDPAKLLPQFTNRMPTLRIATVVLFDRLNTPANDQLYARQHLITFLRQIKNEDRIGLYVLEPDQIRVLHDFTNDARSLVRAMSRYTAMTSNEAADATLPELEESGTPLDAELAAFLERANANIAAHFTGLRGEATVAAFHAIANHLAGVEGRKTLIWVTSGFPLQAFADRGKNMSTEIQRMIRPLNDANVTVYAVDARGLLPALSYDARGKVLVTTLSTVQTNQDILQIAAAETGGRAFVNTNDINGAVRRAVDESRVTYTLGYYPAHGKWDGAYRSIKVQVNRRGVQIRHRRGYLAAAASQRVSSTTAIRAALMSPLEALGVELSARIEREPGAANEIKIYVSIAPGAVAFEPAGEMWKGTLDIVIAQKLADGTAPKTVDQRFDLSLRRDRYEEARTVGFTIDKTLTLLPTVQSLYVIVHDVLTGTTGSIVIAADELRAALGGGGQLSAFSYRLSARTADR